MTLNTQGSDSEDWMKHSPPCGVGNAPDRHVKGDSLLDSSLPADINNTLSNVGATEITSLAGHRDNRYNDNAMARLPKGYWVPIGWSRISELVQTVQVDAGRNMQPMEFSDDEKDLTVADVAAPYLTWWCHVLPSDPFIDAWLSNAQWLHPAISIALRDESRLISERMKYLFYEVPVRVAGGLLFELLGAISWCSIC